MGDMGINAQAVGWKPDVGQHEKFRIRLLCEKAPPVRVSKQIIATKAAESVGLMRAEAIG